MSGTCCKSSIARIITVGGIDTGIIDLDKILMDIYLLGLKDEREIESELLKRVGEKNYITESWKLYYSIALLSEYRKFLKEREASITKTPVIKTARIEHKRYSFGQRIKRKLLKIFP